MVSVNKKNRIDPLWSIRFNIPFWLALIPPIRTYRLYNLVSQFVY